MDLKEKNLKTLDSFLKLEKDWNGYLAEPFDPKLIERCKRIISKLDIQPGFIAPTAADSIQIEYEDKRKYLEFEIFIDKIDSLVVEKPKNLKEKYSKVRHKEYENITELEMKELINKLWR